jgi:capsular exopolysaccharide synthesis family protein
MPESPSLYAGDGHPGGGPSRENGASPLYDEADAPPSGVERLRALLGTLWGGKWIVLGVFALVVGAAAFYTYTRTPQYQTSTLLLVDLGQGQSPVPSLTGGASGQSMFGGSQRNLANQVLVLNQSDALAREVAYRLDTIETHPRTGEPLQFLTTPTGEDRSRAALAGLVKGRTQVRSSGRDVDAIRITATGPVPEEAALIANEYADAYIDRTQAKSQESIRARRRFLEDQVDKFASRVDSADEALASYMQEEDAVSLDQESSRLVQQTSQLEARHDELRIELDMAESALSTKRQELERIRPRLAERLSSGIQTELQQVQQEKAHVAGEINRVRTRNPNLDPTANTQRARDLRRLQRRAQRLETQADSLASDYVERTLAAGGIGAGGGGGEGESSGGRGVSYVVQLQREIAQQEIQVNGLRAQINTVENQIEENRTRLQNLPPKSLRLADLQRQKQSMEQTYGFLRQKLQETRMQEESEVGFAERIRSAGVPVRPISPNSQRNLMLAAMLGLLLGGGLVVLREKLDTRLRSPGDVEALGEHVLGVVPSMEETIENEFDGQRTLTINGDEVRSTLIMLTSPMSAVAEAYRRLRTNLRYASPDADLRSLVVTSAAKGEGKTTTSTNLAVAQAQAGQKTLLIDADLRKSRLHRFFDVPRTPGLTEALYDTPDPDDLPVIADNLSLLPGGEEVPNPAELLGAQRMRALLDRMEQAFDLVIVDTAPVLLFSDPMALVAHTDGALLVAAAGETEGPALEHAAARLDDVQATRLGVVLNGFDPEDQRGGYGYGSYGYGYGGYGYGYGAYGYAYDEDLEAYYEDDEPRGPRSVTARVQSWWNGV